jgi:heme exporter protein A
MRSDRLSASNTQVDTQGACRYALRLKDVSKTFGNRHAVDHMDFDLPRGAFLSIFGPNGAGKTTLLRMLSTLSRPSAGSIELLGIDIKEHPDQARRHIGFISHQSMLYGDLSAEENLMIAARLYGVVHPEQRVADMLDAVELSHRRLDLARTFSRGMTQRLSIARALINDPDIVFLDEPYSGLDPHAVEVFDELIASVRADRTFVMVSHDLDKGLAACTHALVMARGRRVYFSSREDLDRDSFSDLYRRTVGMGVS